MLCCRWFKLSMIFTTTISIILCAPQNELRYTNSIQFPLKSNVNNYQSSFLGIRLQTSFSGPKVLSIVDTKINNNGKSEKPETPYPDIKPRIKYIEMNKKTDISPRECAGIHLDCNNKKELDKEIYKIFVKDVKPKADKENNTHESTTESSTDFSLDTTTDFPNESTIDFTTESDEYESTTGDEDLLNRMAVPPQVVASLLG